jgi:hypothetical protein
VIGPFFAEIERVLLERDGQSLTRVELGGLIGPYAGRFHDGHRWEHNDPWGIIDRLAREGRLIELSDMVYLVHARALEPVPAAGPRLRPSGLGERAVQ